jgi:hypothetical protein
MEWIKHMTKRNGLPFELVSKFGADGYMVYFKTLELLAEGNYFFEPMIESKNFFIHEMISVKIEKLSKIYDWLQENGKIKFTETIDKYSVFVPKLEELNPEYARKHADILEAGRKPDGSRTEAGRKPDGVEVSNRSKEVKKKENTTSINSTTETVMLDIFNTWNLIPDIRKCEVLTDKRKKVLSERIKDSFFSANWKEALRRIYNSPFIRGRVKKGEGHEHWKPNFDWFIRPDGRDTAPVVKIMEGVYDAKNEERESD